MPTRFATSVWRRRHPEWAAELEAEGSTLTFRLPYSAIPRHAAHRGRSVLQRLRGTAGRPWITEDARWLIESMLRPTDVVLEFGAGRSTEWFARQVASVVSVEAFDEWHARVTGQLAEQGVRNVTVELVSEAELGLGSAAHRAAFVGARPDLGRDSVDVVFVDGDYRDACALRAVDAVRSGGLIIVDNANTYLPSDTSVPWHVPAPASPAWADFVERVREWRRVWTTNGLWDTALWIKP